MIESQAQSVGEEKLLLLTIAKHLLGVLGSERINMTTNESNTLNQSIITLPTIFIIKVLQGHECRCLTCEPDVMKHLYDKAILDVKESKKVELKQSTIHQLTIEYESLYEDEAHAQTSVDHEQVKVLRKQLKDELRAEVTADALNEATRKSFRVASDIHQAAVPEAYRFYHQVPADIAATNCIKHR